MSKFVLSLFFLSAMLVSAEVAFPSTVEVRCGKLKMQLSGDKYWNIDKIWFDNNYVGESSGFWGTVFGLSRGWIGSGHKETGNTEKVLNLELFADGRTVSAAEAKRPILCRKFRMVKRSRAQSIIFDYELELGSDTLSEQCKLESPKTVKVSILYNFMHCWSRKMSGYHVALDDGGFRRGTFKGDSGYPFKGGARWLSFYNSHAGIGIVQQSSGDPSTYLVWDRRGNRKIYNIASIDRKKMIGKKSYRYGMETRFFSSTPQNWVKTAEKLIGVKSVPGPGKK